MSAAHFYSRKLLLHTPLTTAPLPSPISGTGDGSSSSSSSSSAEQYPGDRSFDANVVMVLSVLLCALICSLGLNSIIRCALRCSTFVSSSSSSSISSDPNSTQSTNTGVKKKALKMFPTVNYSADMNLPGLDTECAICLSEFADGDRLRLLPKCNHGFHVRCIDKWLNSHSSCPKCRHNLLETCQKIVGCAASSSEHIPAVQDPAVVVIAVSPLEHEGPIPSYRGNS